MSDETIPAVCTCSSNLMSIHDCAVHGAGLPCSPGCPVHGQTESLRPRPIKGATVTSDDPTPDLLDLMAEALTATFKGHEARRFQALAANRVLAERMWPPVKAALDQRDASLAESRTARDSLRNRIRELERANTSFQEINTIRTAERDQLKATVARVRKAADQLDRLRAAAESDKTSNPGLAAGLYADAYEHAVQQIRDALDVLPEDLAFAQSDLPAVRAFAANLDPRRER